MNYRSSKMKVQNMLKKFAKSVQFSTTTRVIVRKSKVSVKKDILGSKC